MNGEGDECHTPECALCFHNSPGHPIHPELYEVLEVSEGVNELANGQRAPWHGR